MSKTSKIPGTFNGGVPPNIEWDPNNPPILNSCSDQLNHLPNCDGTCPKSRELEELEVDLINENREWVRIGMDTSKVAVNLFRMQHQINAVINVLEYDGIISRAELDREFQKSLLEDMRKMREAVGDQVKRTKLGLPAKPGILGPDGKLL